MAELKTKETKASVEKYIAAVKDEVARQDCMTLVGIMKKITKSEPKMWGSAIVGFGNYHYRSEKTGREGDWFYMGFSPRKKALSVYGTGQGCLNIKKLADYDRKELITMLTTCYKNLRKKK